MRFVLNVVFSEMPDKCVAPGCTSNYQSALRNEGYVQVFGFPKDEERRREWVRAIPRSNWTPPQRAFICVKHFHEEDLEWIERFNKGKGVWCEFKRQKPVLAPNAVPKLFPNVPSYLGSNSSVSKRTDPEERIQVRSVTLDTSQVIFQKLVLG